MSILRPDPFSDWVLTNTVNYIYDGMRVIQERDANNVPTVSYTRGTDLSGSLQGAGGIGGLLARSHNFTNCSTTFTYWITNDTPYCIYDLVIWDGYGTYYNGEYIAANDVVQFSLPAVAGNFYQVYGFSCEPYYVQVFTEGFTATLDTHSVQFYLVGLDPYYSYFDSGDLVCNGGGIWQTHDYYHADGNGNITALVDTNQSLSASYRYDPFGNTISQSGSLADANVYRFSSKEIHLATGLYYYGFRWYDPYLQRWLNRDPIFEKGGLNLYLFVRNSPLNVIDTDGRRGATVDIPTGPTVSTPTPGPTTIPKPLPPPASIICRVAVPLAVAYIVGDALSDAIEGVSEILYPDPLPDDAPPKPTRPPKKKCTYVCRIEDKGRTITKRVTVPVPANGICPTHISAEGVNCTLDE